MGISELFSYKLKREDVELVQKIDKIETHDMLRRSLAHKSNASEIESKEILSVLANEQPVKAFDELLRKYAFWEPTFIRASRTFVFSYPVPVNVFSLFRSEAKQFFYNDIIIEGVDPYLGYGKWKH